MSAPRINVWPVPDNGKYTFKYYRMRRIEDAGLRVETADMLSGYSLLGGWPAYHIAMKEPDMAGRLQC